MKLSLNMKLFIMILCLTTFFYGIIGSGYVLITLAFIPVVYKIPKYFTKNLWNQAAWLCFIVFLILSSNFSRSPSSTYKFIFVIVSYFLINSILGDEPGWQKYYSRIAFLFAAINVLATFASLFAPQFMISLAKKLYSGDALYMYLQLFDNGSYAGINSDTSVNAFFISLVLAFAVSSITTNNKKTAYIFMVLSIIALLLTNKRSFIVANGVALVVLLWRSFSSSENKKKIILSLLFLGAAIFIIFKYSSASQGLMEKMELMQEGDDISNGRYLLWKYVLAMWKLNPIFGTGANTLTGTYGFSAHNVYLQVLAENGIFGAVSYVLLILTIFIRSVKAYGLILKNNILEKQDMIICGFSIYVEVLFIVYSFFGNPLFGMTFMPPFIIADAALQSYMKFECSKFTKNEKV